MVLQLRQPKKVSPSEEFKHWSSLSKSVLTDTLSAMSKAKAKAKGRTIAAKSKESTRRKGAQIHSATGDRPRSIRVTVDLSPSDYESLREWSYAERMSHSDVLRSLVRMLATDQSTAAEVRRRAKRTSEGLATTH